MKDIDKVIQRTKNLKGKTIKDFQENTGGFERKAAPKKAQVDPVLSRNVFLENYNVKNDDDENIKLSEFKGDDVEFVKLFSPLFNEMGLTIDNVDFFSNTVQIKDSKGNELTRLSTNDSNSSDMIINFLKGYLKNEKGGVLQELLTQGVIPQMARGGKPKGGNDDTPTSTTCPDGKTFDTILQKCI
jgi:hypothetical protein